MYNTLKYQININGELETRGPYFFYQNHGKAIPIFKDQRYISFKCLGKEQCDAEHIVTIEQNQLEDLNGECF